MIPWTPITDQQRNSTSAIRLMCSLRALCGYVDVPGGELLHGFHPDIIHESELEVHGTTRSASQGGVARHINLYNIQRPHSSLDKQTPDEFYFATPRAIQQQHERRRVAHLFVMRLLQATNARRRGQLLRRCLPAGLHS